MSNSYIYIGAAWKKEGKNGTFLSFSINPEEVARCTPDAKGKIPATLYKNEKKTKDNQPDYNLAVKVEGDAAQSAPVKDDLPF
jgi:uncharacterized protein (DUF736 family)